MQLYGKAPGPLTTYTFVNPCQPFAIITAIPNTYGCYSFSATNGGAPDPNGFYTWDFGDGTNATGDYVYHCYSPGIGTLNFTVTVAYNSAALCGPMPTQSLYTMTLSPPSQTTCVNQTPSVSLAGLTATVWSGFIIPETMFEYKFGDGSAPTSSSNVHTYPKCGNYVIEVKSWDMNQPTVLCYAYAALNIACPTATFTGLEDYDQRPGLVFPNPAQGILYVKSGKKINGIKIVDVSGRESFYEPLLIGGRVAIDVSGFQPGVYFIECINEDSSKTIARFIKD